MNDLITAIVICALIWMVMIEMAIVSIAVDINAILKEIRRRRVKDE